MVKPHPTPFTLPRILKHKRNYPGPHLHPQPRTNPSHKPLEPMSQVKTISTTTNLLITVSFDHESYLRIYKGKHASRKGSKH